MDHFRKVSQHMEPDNIETLKEEVKKLKRGYQISERGDKKTEGGGCFDKQNSAAAEA